MCRIFPYGHFKIDSENYTIATYNFSAEQLYKARYCDIVIEKEDYPTSGFKLEFIEISYWRYYLYR